MMMAKTGFVRRHKVLSSGRLTGTTKITCNKKQVALRKTAHSCVESGYSLSSTDSEDQVATIHNGLDRCAALLKDILQNESERKQSERTETVHQKPEKASSVKTTSRPLLSKVNGSKKRSAKKTTLSTHVHKEIVRVSNRKPPSVNKTAVEKDRTPVNTEQPLVQPVPASFTQHSPVIHQKLNEHVQTQMSLLNIQPPQKSSGIPEVPLRTIPENGCQPVSAFNCRLPTSTPVVSPQHTADPSVVQSGVSMDNFSQCALQMGPVLAPASSSASAAHVQPVPNCSTLPHVLQTVLSNPTKPTVLAVPVSREAVSGQGSQDQQLKETDLIRCIQAHLALLQARDKESECGKADEKCQTVDPVRAQSSNFQEETVEEHGEDTLSEEGGMDGVEMAPVRDTSCQTSFDKTALKHQQKSLQETANKIKTVKYFLRELKALLTDHDDSETLRLLGEVEDCISLLPAAVDSSNLQAEIALALQPLRSENAQLRSRQVRILNQQLKEQKTAEKECNLDGNAEFISLQSLNRTLQSQLNDSVKNVESLQNKNEELNKILESHREEEKRLTRAIHEREQELLEKKHLYDIESTKLKLEADEMLSNMKSFQYKVQAAEKENQILGITLRQRDAEVNRLRELTRALQGSMSKLLSDLTVDTKPKPGKSLSKALLEIHEKQLQSDMYPLSASIMSYLQNVETDPVQVNTDLLSKGEMKEAADQVDDRATEHSPQKSSPLAHAPVNMSTFLKPDIVAASDLSTLVEDKLDETIYIPLTSSPSKRLVVAAERCGISVRDPKYLDLGLADSKGPSRFGVLVFDKFSGSCTLKKTVENKSETMGKTAKLEGKRPQTQPKEITNRAAKEILDNPGRLQPDKFFSTPVSHCEGNVQKKGIGISAPDSSFSTFDGLSKKSEWTTCSFSTFTSQDEEDFKNGLAALDANIARLQKTLQNNLIK